MFAGECIWFQNDSVSISFVNITNKVELSMKKNSIFRKKKKRNIRPGQIVYFLNVTYWSAVRDALMKHLRDKIKYTC